MTEKLRSSSALFKRAEQLKRWEESDTNKESTNPQHAPRIQFSSGIVFLAACTAGDKGEIERLIEIGADINTSNVDGLTALHQACIDDNLDMVEFLIGQGADVNRGDNEGWTPLHATASCGFISIARFLLEHGADVGAVNYDRELPIDIAESDAMKKLLQDVIDEKGINCEMCRRAEADALLRDANNWALNGYVEVRDSKTGGTPLHIAAAKGYEEVAQVLLEDCNVDVEVLDYEGWTPLHAAALWGQKATAEVLIKFGADPYFKNSSGQTAMDVADPNITQWMAEVYMDVARRTNYNKKRKGNVTELQDEARCLESNAQDEKENQEPCQPPEAIKVPEGKPPKARAQSPEVSSEVSEKETMEEMPSWRRSGSFRYRQVDPTMDNETILRRTRSFENDKTFYQRYRDLTARIKASSYPSIPPAHAAPAPPLAIETTESSNKDKGKNEGIHARLTPTEQRDRDANTWSPSSVENAVSTNHQTTVRSFAESVESNSSNSSPSATTPTKLSPGNIFKNFFKSFVPPVRDDESETQRKAHAKRVRETRRSTQGVTLDEIKSAEQLVKKKAGNGQETPPTTVHKKGEESPSGTEKNSTGRASGTDVAVTLALACATATATATVAANSERRPSWRLRLDPTNKFELEDAERFVPRAGSSTEAVVTLPLRRPPSGASVNATTPTDRIDDAEKEDISPKSKSPCTPPFSSQAVLNVIQRRRRPKRKLTGLVQVDMEDIVNGGGKGDGQSESDRSGSEPAEAEDDEDVDYKALYEASSGELQRLRALLNTSKQQLREARSTITRLTEGTQSPLNETEKRQKRAMERKLSEMEEELKHMQALQVENQRLKDENGALIRVISKLSK